MAAPYRAALLTPLPGTQPERHRDWRKNSFTPRPSVITLIAGILGVLSATTLWAAAYNPIEYGNLLSRAMQQGVVRVLVGLDIDGSLTAIRQNLAAVNAAADAKANAVLAELGADAWQTAISRNGLGQMSVYVTSQGLAKLARSNYVRTFGPDVTDGMRSRVYDGDSRIAAIEAEIDAKSVADVEITLNLENLDFDIGPDGGTVYLPSDAQLNELKVRIPAFLNSLSGRVVVNLADLQARVNDPAFQKPTIELRITREGLYALKEHAAVRAIRLVSGTAATPPYFDPEALDTAKKEGSARVIIELRRPAPYTPLMGYVPAKAWQSQADAIRRSVADILSAGGSGVVRTQEFAGLPALAADLTAAALTRLYQAADSRISSVTLNRPMAYPALNFSTPLIHMPSAWNAGYTASGQTIVVYDTGIQKTHPFLQSATGQPKVYFEGCYGTNNASYTSPCPNQDANGDSPLGLAGSGEPCSAPDCVHGTHVAGIAAGRNGFPSDPNYYVHGVAPDAQLVSVKVFSVSNFGGPSAAQYDDLELGIQALLSAVQNSGSSEFVANFSLGGQNPNTSDCPNFDYAFTDRVDQLTSLKVPVVVATGNSSWRNAIAWPACVPRTIKVAAVCTSTAIVYDSGGNPGQCYPDQLYPFSNISSFSFNGPLLLAPGAIVTSSIPGNGFAAYHGTSMAAPHVAGFYAVLKAAAPGATVADVTAWVVTNGVNVSTPVGTLKRINVPF